MSEFDKPEKVKMPGPPAALVYATFPSLEVAETIGTLIIDANLAACVNIVPGMVSIYRWQGARHRDHEVVAIVKTRLELAEAVMELIRGRHPYSNPALLVVPVAGGSKPFLDWIHAETAAAATGRGGSGG